ncbi:hypothetical protein Rxycam_01916 [Rubrobacter xylanophilus DSM 9941]|nr:hypothetical protein Rxycam_01916 [Rubrobacter xylanophilus DSM 9941]
MVAGDRLWTNREGIEEYNIRWHWIQKPSTSGFTAVLRVKNEAKSLPFVLPPILRSVEHVLLVDNLSTDGTPQLAKEIAREEGLEEKLEVLSYPFEVSRCGPEHLATYPDSVHSLTYFYNWSFSHVRTRYALKWDGDMVLSPEGEQILRNLAWQLEGTDGAVTIPRSPVYVESERVAYLDTQPGAAEPWGWRNSPAYTISKAFDWELRLPNPGDPVFRLPNFMCFELKWLEADEFAHWSHTVFKETINARKRREWELFYSLHGGAEIPEGVVRIESPEGIHVVEHLRKVFTKTLREVSAKREIHPTTLES